MAIDSNGNVGIGTTSPAATLDVNGMLGSSKALAPATANLGTVTLTDSKFLLYNYSSSNWSGLGSDVSGNFWLRTGTTSNNLLVMSSTGNVGIGTTNPVTKLAVNGELVRQIQRIHGNGPNDATSSGAITSRVLTFVKKGGTETSVRIAYHDNFRAYSGATTSVACRWEVKINGNSCASGAIYQDVYTYLQNGNHHRPGEIVGYCDSLAAGTYTLQVYTSATPGTTAGDCYTGWNTSHWVIEAEEIY
jgi:hypothetical protein